MNTYGFRFIRYFLLFLALLFSFSFLFGWWKSQPVATPVSVGIGIDLPLIEATAIDPSDWNTSQIFTEKKHGYQNSTTSGIYSSTPRKGKAGSS